MDLTISIKFRDGRWVVTQDGDDAGSISSHLDGNAVLAEVIRAVQRMQRSAMEQEAKP